MATPKAKLCSVLVLIILVIMHSGPCWSGKKATKKKISYQNNESESYLPNVRRREHEKRHTISIKAFMNQTSYTKLTNICSENATACANIIPQRNVGSSSKENLKDVVRIKQFSKEKPPVRLNNGTVLWRQPMEKVTETEPDVMDHSTEEGNLDSMSTDFDTSVENDNVTSAEVNPDKINKKLLKINDFYNDYNDGKTSRINRKRIPINKKYTNDSSKLPVQTVTLGQLARKLIFPDWLWTRFAVDRKTGISAIDIIPNHEFIPTIKPPQMPTITYENNFSKFMKMFSTVKIRNSQCFAPSGQNGTCYQSQECNTMGGTAAAPCAQGFGVCCVFLNKCGDTTSRNGSYFIDNAMTFSKGVTTCNLRINKASPSIRQMRLDFHMFTLQPPNAGNCDTDRFVVSAQNTNNIIPILCGQNTGSHIYVETDGPSNGIQLSIMTTGEGPRRWSIRVTQYETIQPSGAPSHCLQYHTGVMGTVRSFNYISETSPQYLNNLNYAICIRKEAGFCSITFSNTGPDNQYYALQIVNANEQGNLVLPSGQAGVGIRDCPYDYIIVNGNRLCGERFNDATTGITYVEDAPVTDISNGPFMISVRTNEIDVGGGFSLYYRQNPCMSSPG